VTARLWLAVVLLSAGCGLQERFESLTRGVDPAETGTVVHDDVRYTYEGLSGTEAVREAEVLVENMSEQVKPTRVLSAGLDTAAGLLDAQEGPGCTTRPDVPAGESARVVFCYLMPEGRRTGSPVLVLDIGGVVEHRLAVER